MRVPAPRAFHAACVNLCVCTHTYGCMYQGAYLCMYIPGHVCTFICLVRLLYPWDWSLFVCMPQFLLISSGVYQPQ